MKLIEAIKDLDKHDAEATIYAAEPWSEESHTVIAFEPVEGGIPVEASGLSYFLEVFIARNFLDDWEPTLKAPPTSSEQCSRLIQYAINDA